MLANGSASHAEISDSTACVAAWPASFHPANATIMIGARSSGVDSTVRYGFGSSIVNAEIAWSMPGTQGDGEILNARHLRRLLAGAVVVVTTKVDSEYRGATASAVMVASFEPLQMLVSLESESQMAGWLSQSRHFAVNI